LYLKIKYPERMTTDALAAKRASVICLLCTMSSIHIQFIKTKGMRLGFFGQSAFIIVMKMKQVGVCSPGSLQSSWDCDCVADSLPKEGVVE
jgi:hypothetical protein